MSMSRRELLGVFQGDWAQKNIGEQGKGKPEPSVWAKDFGEQYTKRTARAEEQDLGLEITARLPSRSGPQRDATGEIVVKGLRSPTRKGDLPFSN